MTALNSGPVPADDPAVVPTRARPGSWVYLSLALANLGLYSMFFGSLSLLLPRQVADIVGEDHKVSALGIVTGVAALAAAVGQPLAGLLSDRTRFPLGRRNTWVLGGGVASALLILVVSRTTTIPLLVVAWSLVQAAGNSAQAGLAAALAERIPEERRGTASAGVGLATMVGIVIGPVLARLGGGTTGGYTLLAGAVLLSSLIFAFTTKDVPAAAKPDQAAAVEKPPADPQQRRDFWWGFAGRAALFLAYSMISGYTLYMLEDYVGLSDHDAEAKLAAVTAVLGICTIIVMPVSGVLADRSGRLKPFVIASSLIFVPGFAAMLVSPTFGGLLAGNALCGIAFGSYMAVDQALMTRVLPDMDDAGRDLGVLNIAAAGPQVAAPFVAGLIISALGGYRTLFVTGIVLAVLGALAVKPIRSVR